MLKRGGILPDSARIVLLHGRHYLQQNNRAHRLRRRPSTVHPNAEVTEGHIKVKVTTDEGHYNHNQERGQKRYGRNDINRSLIMDDY